MISRSRAACTAVLWVSIAATALAARAGSFQVNPVRIELSDGATAAAVVVRNDGSDPVVVQTSILEWTQAEGKDVYRPSSDALATPPIATIPPGGEQIVRVGLRRMPDPTRELTYRLFVHEVPPPPQPGFNGLQVALRIGLPVFVQPLSGVKRDLDWSAVRLPDNRIRLTLRNRGNAHLQVSDFTLRAPSNREPVARQASLTYVLGGQSGEWLLEAERLPGATTTLDLTAFTDAGEINATIRLEP